MMQATSFAKSWINSLRSTVADQLTQYSHSAFVNIVLIFQESALLTCSNSNYSQENGNAMSSWFESQCNCDTHQTSQLFKQPHSLFDDLQNLHDFDYPSGPQKVCQHCSRVQIQTQKNQYSQQQLQQSGPKVQRLEFDFACNVFHYRKREPFEESIQDPQQSQEMVNQSENDKNNHNEIVKLCIPLKYREGKGLIEILDNFDDSQSEINDDQQQSSSGSGHNMLLYSMTLQGMLYNQDLKQYEKAFVQNLKKNLNKPQRMHRVQSRISVDEEKLLGQSILESEYLSVVQSSDYNYHYQMSEKSKLSSLIDDDEDMLKRLEDTKELQSFTLLMSVTAAAAMGGVATIGKNLVLRRSPQKIQQSSQRKQESIMADELQQEKASLVKSEYLLMESSQDYYCNDNMSQKEVDKDEFELLSGVMFENQEEEMLRRMEMEKDYYLIGKL